MTNTIHANLEILKIEQCPKLSASAEGHITYHILRDPTDKALYIAIAGNEGGGYFSHEAVALDKIEQCLQELQATGKPFPAIRLKSIFVGKSANNPSFMAAALRHEKLLSPSPEMPKLFFPTEGLGEWRVLMAGMPALSQSIPSQPATATPAAKAEKPAKTGKSAKKAKPASTPDPVPAPPHVTEDKHAEDTQP